MERSTFEHLVGSVLDSLPQRYATRLDNLIFLVEDRADAATLAEVGLAAEDELLGFFSGTPLTERTHDQIDDGPDRIILYQQAIEDEALACDLPLRRVILETLCHEIAHYFGFSEADMDPIENLWAERD